MRECATYHPVLPLSIIPKSVHIKYIDEDTGFCSKILFSLGFKQLFEV